MAALRSARGGDRSLRWRDWLAGYGATWVLPVPIGLAVAVLAMLYRVPFEALGLAIPAETVASYAFGLGMVMMMMPMFSWLGLVLSVPIVWAVLRMGLGGWLSFGIGGGATGALAAAALGGMAAPVPIGVGVLSGLFFRQMLRWLRPEALAPEKNF